jgi:1-acyl-sn-glycerol-3-phosphate acyltransferase
MRIFLSVIFWIIFQIDFLVVFLISFPLVLLGKAGSDALYYLIKFLLRILFFVFFIRGKVTGWEKLAFKEKVIFSSNMPTIFTPLFYLAYLPVRVKFAAEEKMFRIPFLGWVMKVLGCLSLPRESQEYFIFAQKVLGPDPVLIFQSSPALKELKAARVVPLTIHGDEKVIAHGLISPGQIEMVIF